MQPDPPDPLDQQEQLALLVLLVLLGLLAPLDRLAQTEPSFEPQSSIPEPMAE